eukprot:5214484-Ditylum_brightwellii.AAC.1
MDQIKNLNEIVDNVKMMQDKGHMKLLTDKEDLELKNSDLNSQLEEISSKLDLVEASLVEKEDEVVTLKNSLKNETRSR